MRQPTVIRISVPRQEPPALPLKFNPARPLLVLTAQLARLLARLPDDEPFELLGVPLRVLAGLPRRKAVLARDLAQTLALDSGHLSRVLSKLEHHGMIQRAATTDRRQSAITLTAFGRYTLRRNHQRREAALVLLLEELGDADHKALAKAFDKANEVLERFDGA